ncbi:hypothetical protein [Variovorax rhizosphaerae]|uniref:Uncharacterized protein n=1 Tax=Variovorax rhizosphaerae TaxID=1836200 RepID=A0ABU8WZD0_9BURK
MFKKILIANRGESGRKAASAKPKCMVRAARTAKCMARAARAGDFHAETHNV